MFLGVIAAVAPPIIGGLFGSSASQSAGQTQSDAANAATAAQLQMYNQTAANVAPWLSSGQTALNKLVAGTNDGSLMPVGYTPFSLSNFQQDPGYQFTLQQGTNALENASSLTGGMNSNNLKGLVNWAQGNAGNEFQTALNNYMAQFQLGNQTTQQKYNNLAGLSASGMGAALQQGQIGTNVGQNIGQNIIGAGNAVAAGKIGSANALVGGINGAFNNYNQYLQRQYMSPPYMSDPAADGNWGGSYTGFNDPNNYG